MFCNCDDAIGERRDYTDSSAFALYFLRHFFRLKLKKLICTHYGSQQDLFNAGVKGYIFTKEGAHEIKHTKLLCVAKLQRKLKFAFMKA
ncbi:hypothetical protein HSHS1_18150 [Helicobacter suis HS1]|nr:adenine-specific methyltransferase EcoRI family protein [Helicobacter suis]BDR29054.1 hypothetical protein HSHS1_18150 [Helicobacter suis HS1]